ncbi:hypothetical protein [Sphingobium sp. RAC03]|uniref:hypothetical protein n=1 Tax=Sphingobium sp. RAC03 TaxID=1843368 RepID=UPI001F353FFF|nr:hypothetical protein [Sphingobium sp. RAC03]
MFGKGAAQNGDFSAGRDQLRDRRIGVCAAAISSKARWHDGDTATVLAQPEQGRAQMPRPGLPVIAASLAATEGRIDQDHRRVIAQRQQVMEIFCVMAGDSLPDGKREQRRAVGIAFIERESAAPRRDGSKQHSRACRRFENMILCPKACGLDRQPGEGQRRAELLHRDLLFAAIAMRGQAGFKTAQGGVTGSRISGTGDATFPPPQEQYQGDFKHVIGLAHRPCALCIARAKPGGHQLS